VDLYVLDMYFPQSSMNGQEQLLRLDKAWISYCNAERVLAKTLADLGQSFAGGRRLAQEVKAKHFGHIPFVYFTRKGNLLDAMEAYEQIGALSVIKKPDPRGAVPEDDLERCAAYDKAMAENVDTLARAFESAIRRGGWWFRHRDRLSGSMGGNPTLCLIAAATCDRARSSRRARQPCTPPAPRGPCSTRLCRPLGRC
jgi:hypothetical protein